MNLLNALEIISIISSSMHNAQNINNHLFLALNQAIKKAKSVNVDKGL